MKRKDWFIILAPLFVVWLTDHATKLWGESIEETLQFGFLTFRLYHNHGAFLGFFSDLPPLLRIVSLSTIGAFLVFSYAIAQYMLPIKSLRLRLGMSILLGGIIGNVSDRVIWGYVVDFLIFDFSLIKSQPLNLADLFQWVGYGLIAIALIRDEELLWPQQNNRKRLWINPDYQVRYIFFLLIITLSLTLIGVIFSYTYLRVTIFELIGENRFIPSRFLIPFIFTYLSINLTFCCFLIFIGRKISHHNAGPIYAFDKYVSDLLDGRNRRFRLRAGDEFKQLEKLGNRLADFFKEINHIDTEDEIKTLTTQNDNAEDFSIAAVPVDDQRPNYTTKPLDIQEVAEDSVVKNRRDCPLCLTPSLLFAKSPYIPRLVECSHCHFTFDPSPSESPRPISQDNSFTHVDDHNTINNYELDQKVNSINWKKRFEKALKLNPEIQSYLDIGCAVGDSLNTATEYNFPLIHGLETSQAACEKAREKGFTVFHGTLPETSFLLKTYDLITLFNVLEHALDPSTFMRECHDKLNSKGLLMIQTPNINSWSAKLLRGKWYHLKDKSLLSLFTPQTIKWLAENNGLEIISIESSVSYLSIGAITRRLTFYGLTLPQKLTRWIPKPILENLIFPIKTGNMLLILTRQNKL